MAIAYFHENMIRKCQGKRSFATEAEARGTALPGMVVIYCPICIGYHKTSKHRDNFLALTATPEQVLEMFR